MRTYRRYVMPPTSIDLDLFILALVQRGSATPYDLKSRAGISVGSSAPVLDRLKHEGLVKGSNPGARDRVQFSITNSGQKKLRSEWEALLAERPTDPDTILRITYLAWALGRQDTVTTFIGSSADTLLSAAATRRAEAHQLQAHLENLGGEAFRWLKTNFEAARLEAQSKALRKLGDQIRNKKKKR